jgi:pimeloyl-ACP methyl ester carboxylesterase
VPTGAAFGQLMRGEFVEVGPHRLYYYAAGSRGQGDPIVLLHGFPTTSHLWSELVSLLPKGHRIVVPDLLGYGRSDLADRASLSIPAHADRVVGLLNTLRIERATLVGHHMGACIATSVAARSPARVAHLALLHPLGGDVTLTGTLAVLRAFLPIVRLFPSAAFRGSLRRELLSWYSDPIRARHSVDQYLAGWAPAARWRVFLRQLADLTEADVRLCTAQLAGLDMPVALVASDLDPAVPRVALDRIRDSMPQAPLDIIRDARHFSPEESPEQVAEVIARLVKS